MSAVGSHLAKPNNVRFITGHTLQNGLIAAWLLTENSGSVTMDSAGTLNGLLTSNASWEMGPMGPAIGLAKATTDTIDTGSGLNNLTGTVSSYACWARIDSFDSVGAALLDDANSSAYYLLSTTQAFVQGGAGIDYNMTLDDSKWHHYVMVSDGVIKYIYIDGILRGTRTEAGVSYNSSAKNFVIGEWGVSLNWTLDGAYGGGLLYDRAINPHEVRELYRDQWQMFRHKKLLQNITENHSEGVSASVVPYYYQKYIGGF